jgi:hypothetical protein
MNGEFLEALDQIQKAKGIPMAALIQTVEAAMQSAYRKHYGVSEEVRLEIDHDKATVRMIARRPIYPAGAEADAAALAANGEIGPDGVPIGLDIAPRGHPVRRA